MKNVDIINDFYRFLLTERQCSLNTFLSYKADVKQLTNYLIEENIDILNVQLENLQDFLRNLRDNNVSARSVLRKVSCLKLFFEYCKDKYGSKNFANKLDCPIAEKKLPEYLNEQDIKLLFNACENEKNVGAQRNRVMLYLLYSTGMRISELVNLNIDSIDFEQSTIKVYGKRSKERLVPIQNFVLDVLKDYLNTIFLKLYKNYKSENLKIILFPTFYSGKIKYMTRQLFWIYLKNLAKKTSISKSFSPHTLRHSLATHLLKNGANIRALQMLLGHEQLNTVQIYTHIEKSHLRKIYDKKHIRS